MLIEDNADIRDLVAGVLERAGFTVRRAVDGSAGMRDFFAHRPDLVILDVAMPELDGWEVLERIRELSETPVLMLTAHAEELDKVRGLRSGADDYVTKPVGNQELLARVEALLRRARADDGPPAVLYDDLVEIDSAAGAEPITTVRGFGYRYDPS